MNNMKNKKLNTKIKIGKNTYSINVSKLIFSISIIILIFFMLFVIFIKGFNKNIDSNTDISKVNAKKYSEQILAEYEKDGMKEKFLTNYSTLQNAIGMYILNNSTLDSNSFTNIFDVLNKELDSGKFNKLDATKLTTWNGKFSINKDGVLKFKFENKNIEPSWIIDSELNNKIILN